MFGKIFDLDTPSRARLRRPPQPTKVRFFCSRINNLEFLVFVFLVRNLYICQKMKNRSSIMRSAEQFRNIKKRDEFLS